MLSLGESHENNIYPYDIDMANVPKYIKIGTNLAISKSSKNKIKKAYGLKFRGKSKKQQKDMVMREAKQLRGGTKNFKNEKYAWRYLAQSYNAALKPIRKQAIERKRRELQRYNVNVTIRWTGYNVDKYGQRRVGRTGEVTFTTTTRERDIGNWIRQMRKQLEESKQDSPFDIIETDVVSQNKTPVARTVPLRYRSMRMAGVLDLDNMVENDVWNKRENMCVPDFIQYRYGERKGFKKITSDEQIGFWATHIEEPTELSGYMLDYDLEVAGKDNLNPLEHGFCIQHIENWCKKARVNMYALVDDELIAHYYTEEARKRRNPPMVFEMKNNHLYPIFDTKRIKSITNKPKNEIEQIIKSNTQQEGKHKDLKEPDDDEVVDTDPDIKIEFMDMELYEGLEEKTRLNYAMEIMCKNNKTTFPKKNL